MTTKMPSVGAILAALVFALSVFAFTLFVWRSFGGDTPLEPQGYRVSVPFGPSGAQLVENADVRIAGVSVGKVKRVAAQGERTLAELELDAPYAPLPQDARAVIRTKTLLGETFVALTPGSRTAPKVPEDGVLAAGQVEETQTVDEVLSTFDARTRDAFRRTFAQVAASLEGRSGDLNTTLGNLAPLTERLQELTTLLADRDDDVRGLVRDGGTVLRDLAREDAQLGRLVERGEDVVAVTARRNADLERLVRTLPGFLADARRTLATAGATARDAKPALDALQPVAPLVAPALRDAEQLLPDVARTARRVPAVVDAAERGLPATTALLRAAPAALRALDVAGRDIVPVLETLAAYRTDAITATAKTASSLQGKIAGQHVLRVAFLLFNESLYGNPRRSPSNRASAYAPPGALGELIAGRTLKSLDCSHTGNPQLVPPIGGSGPPPCLLQEPWTLRGKTALFPGVARDP